jgi:hypothetical protein
MMTDEEARAVWPPISREEVLAKLQELRESNDPETGHIEADALLLRYINDPEIARAFNVLQKWYA